MNKKLIFWTGAALAVWGGYKIYSTLKANTDVANAVGFGVGTVSEDAAAAGLGNTITAEPGE